MQNPVVITGMGLISSIGKNVSEFSKALRTGCSGISQRQSQTNPEIAVKVAAEITDFSFGAQLNEYVQLATVPAEFIDRVKRAVGRHPQGVQCAVAAAIQAWQQAQLFQSPIAGARLGLVVAGNNLTDYYQYGLYEKFKQAPEYLTPTYALHYLDSDHVGTLSELFAIHGEGFTVGGASASGNVGVIKGCQMIQLGLVDACLVVGAMAQLTPLELQGFHNLGAMGGKRFANQPDQACRPFDVDHEGFIYGQAAGCLILESQSSASKRQAPQLAEYLGGAVVLDGNRLSNPSESGEVRAMETALQQAQVTTDAVDYINTHGTSSPLGDETELKAIRQVFQDRTESIWLNATKAFTGHCLYSAGVIEAIATIVQMNEGFLHPNRNLVSPIASGFRFCGEQSVPATIRLAVSNSFGFGGFNTAIVLRR